MIGKSNDRGSITGHAVNSKNSNCPYEPNFDWKYADENGKWADAGQGLSIWNQC